jgi:predicted lipoprotein with Yx(FWY)xxD motif
MVEKRTIVEIIGIIALMATMGVVVTTESNNFYSCPGTSSVSDMSCFKLSKADVNGLRTYCYYNPNNATKYKKCSTGWQPITIEQVYNESKSEDIIVPIKEIKAEQYICGQTECIIKV